MKILFIFSFFLFPFFCLAQGNKALVKPAKTDLLEWKVTLNMRIKGSLGSKSDWSDNG